MNRIIKTCALILLAATSSMTFGLEKKIADLKATEKKIADWKAKAAAARPGSNTQKTALAQVARFERELDAQRGGLREEGPAEKRRERLEREEAERIRRENEEEARRLAREQQEGRREAVDLDALADEVADLYKRTIEAAQESGRKDLAHVLRSAATE